MVIFQLLTDAEAREDFSKQVLDVELARDRTERAVREAQFLREKLPALLFGGELKMTSCLVQARRWRSRAR